MPTQVLTAEQKQFIVASNMEGVTDGEVVDSYLALSKIAAATRKATKGNGTNTYATIPTWSAVNWEIEFNIVFPTAYIGSTQTVLDSPSVSNRFNVNLNATTGTIAFPSTFTAKLDGLTITNGSTAHPLDGLTHTLKFTGTSLIEIGTILRSYSLSNTCGATVFNLRLTDLDAPSNSRYYPMDGDGSTNVLAGQSTINNGVWYNRTPSDVVDVLSADKWMTATAPVGIPRLATKGKNGLYCTIPTWTPSGDCKITVSFIPRTAPTSGVASILSSTGGASATFWVYQGTNVNDKVTLRIKRSGVDTWLATPTNLVLNVVNTLVIDIVSGSVTMTLNGVSTGNLGAIDAGSINVSTFYQRDTYGPFTDGHIFDVSLQDLGTPSNSRVYPLDSPYTGTAAAEDSAEIPTDLVPHFAYWSNISGASTINGVAIGSAIERFTYNAPLTIPAGASVRLNLNVGYPVIGKLVKATFSVSGGARAIITGDVCDSTSVVTSGVGVVTIKAVRPSDKVDNAVYKFVDIMNSGTATVTLTLTTLTQSANNGLWTNRTASDVVKIYPDAIKPSETWWVATKFHVTNKGSDNYPMVFSIGGILGSTSVKLQAKTDGGLALEVWDTSPTGVKTNLGGASIAGVAAGGDWNTAGPIIVVAKKNGTTGQTEMWVDKNSGYHSAIRPVSGYPIRGLINLNGEIDVSERTIRQTDGVKVFYFFTYKQLDTTDIPYILQGDNPALFGEVRQGYLLNGDTSEILEQEPLTLYPVEEPPKFQDVVRNYIKSWFTNMMGWIT